uniref:Uncharacterized protein n=1 Tax=Aegilops tauschii TaxID=37682 RepID=M8BF39_AEGTA
MAAIVRQGEVATVPLHKNVLEMKQHTVLGKILSQPKMTKSLINLCINIALETKSIERPNELISVHVELSLNRNQIFIITPNKERNTSRLSTKRVDGHLSPVSWASPGDKVKNKPIEHISNRFTVTPTNGSAYAEKEMLKQTILAQEATFRKQVYELHRLYKVQKDLMALQCRGGESKGYSKAISYSLPSGGIRRVQQMGPPAGHDTRKPSGKFMKGKNIERSLNRVSMRHSNSGSTKEMLLQVPADADDSDDDVVTVWENPAKSLPRNSGSVVGTNLKLSIERTSPMDKNWATGLQPSGVSTVNALNKKVIGSSSTMKKTNFPSVGASSSKNQCYSYGHKLKDRSSGMEWLTHKKTGVDSSTAHYQSSSSIVNPGIFAASSSNAAPRSLWQSSATDYTTRRHYADAELPSAQNGRLPTFQRYHRLHSSEIPGGAQYQHPSPFYDCPKDVNLNNGPRDATATLGQARGSTRILGFTISAATEKDSHRPSTSSTTHMGADSTPLSKGVADLEMQFQNKKDGTSVRNLIDLNVALPFMDVTEMDARQSEGDSVPEEPDGPSTAAAKNLMVMHTGEFQAGPPQGEEAHLEALVGPMFKMKRNTIIRKSPVKSDCELDAPLMRWQAWMGEAELETVAKRRHFFDKLVSTIEEKKHHEAKLGTNEAARHGAGASPSPKGDIGSNAANNLKRREVLTTKDPGVPAFPDVPENRNTHRCPEAGRIRQARTPSCAQTFNRGSWRSTRGDHGPDSASMATPEQQMHQGLLFTAKRAGSAVDDMSSVKQGGAREAPTVAQP